MNTNPKLTVYEAILHFLKTPRHDSQITIEATRVRKLIADNQAVISYPVPSVEDLETEYDNINGYDTPQPSYMTKEIAAAAFADLSMQLRNDRVSWLIRQYLSLINDPSVLLGNILSVKQIEKDGTGFAEIKIRVSDHKLFVHLLCITDSSPEVNPWAVSPATE